MGGLPGPYPRPHPPNPARPQVLRRSAQMVGARLRRRPAPASMRGTPPAILRWAKSPPLAPRLAGASLSRLGLERPVDGLRPRGEDPERLHRLVVQGTPRH